MKTLSFLISGLLMLALPAAAACPSISGGTGSLVDGAGNTWSFGPASGSAWEVYENSSWSAGALATMIETVSGAVYVLGTDGNYWSYTGTVGWQNTGSATDPCPSPATHYLLCHSC